MNRTQMILAATGGVALVGVLATGWLLFGAYGKKGEKLDELESSKASIARILGGKVRPCQESVDVIEQNAAALGDWTRQARAAVAKGDRAIEPDVTPAGFKQTLIDETRALAALTNSATGAAIVPADFTFGFNEYVSGTKLPAASVLPRLQRQWDDIKLLVGVLAQADVSQLADVGIVEKKEEPRRAVRPAAQKPAKAKADKGKKGKGAVETAPVETALSSETYTLQFRTQPSGFVKVFNALAKNDRFVTVDDFTFVRAEDDIAAAIGGDPKKDEQQTSKKTLRRRPRRGAKAETEPEQEEGEKKRGLAVDPDKATPITVTMTVTVHDFGTAVWQPAAGETAAAPETAEETPAAEAVQEEAKEVQE